MTGNQTAHTLRLWAGALSSALPCFYLSWVLFNVWRDPMAWDQGEWVRLGLGLLILEFVLLHSGAFMASVIAKQQALGKKLQYLAGLIAFYSLMVLGFALSLDSDSLLWIFAGVCVGRLFTAISNADEGADLMMARSANGVLLYILVVFATVLLPLPQWGIDPQLLAEIWPDRGGGLWEREPQRAIAGAAVYFLLLGIAEIKTLKPPALKAQDKNHEKQSL
ncbi:MAG: hypothetical protein MRY76_01925 [Pseudomonadales bacterium]|nr:hypothetical protein [Pseudomonadales bacterium]